MALAKMLTTFPAARGTARDRFEESDPIDDIWTCYDKYIFPREPKTVKEKKGFEDVLSNLILIANLVIAAQFRAEDLKRLLSEIKNGLFTRNRSLARVETKEARVSFAMAAEAIGIDPPNEIRELLVNCDPIDGVGNRMTPVVFSAKKKNQTTDQWLDYCCRRLGFILFKNEYPFRKINALNELIMRRKKRKHYVFGFLSDEIDRGSAETLAEEFDSIIFLHSSGKEGHKKLEILCHPIDAMIARLREFQKIEVNDNN